jgi:hypothetical protein
MSFIEVTCYIPRHELTRDEGISLVQTLWNHGMNFGPTINDVPKGSWEEQLQSDISYVRSPIRLDALIDEAIQERYLHLTVFDRGVEFNIHLDPDLVDMATFCFDSPEEIQDLPYGKVTLIKRMGNMPEYIRIPAGPLAHEEGYLIPPYLQTELILVHWAEILCQSLHPLFAFSCDVERGLAASEGDYTAHSDRAFMGALEKGELPPINEWIKDLDIVYFPAFLVEKAQELPWMHAPDRWSKRLSDGGLFSYALSDRYEQVLALDMKVASGEFERDEKEKAIQYIKRARILYESIGDEEGVIWCDQYLDTFLKYRR